MKSVTYIPDDHICSRVRDSLCSRERAILQGFFLSPANEPAFPLSVSLSSSPLGFISVTSTVSSDIPLAEVFIGTTNGRGTRYKLALQAPVRVRHVALANHRISSAAGRRGIRTIPGSPASGNLAATSIRCDRTVCPRKVEDSETSVCPCSVPE